MPENCVFSSWLHFILNSTMRSVSFNLNEVIVLLQRTPHVLSTLLQDLPQYWIYNNEGEETWSPYDILGHLIHGEKTDWIARLEIILEQGENKSFTPFDRFAQFEDSKGKDLHTLLSEFEDLRNRNLQTLQLKNITPKEYHLTGIHPDFGIVTLEQLLSTWATHDLAHINQMTRVMAKQYAHLVGPWKNYIRVLNK